MSGAWHEMAVTQMDLAERMAHGPAGSPNPAAPGMYERIHMLLLAAIADELHRVGDQIEDASKRVTYSR